MARNRTLYFRNAGLYIKPEVTEGTDSVPAGSNAILVSSLNININQNTVDLAYVRPYFGNSQNLQVEQFMTLDFEVDIAGSGTAGTAPKWGPVLLGCAFAETLTALTSAAYNPISTALPSNTIYYYLDGILHKMLGARGTVSFELSANARPMMKYTYTGMYGGIVAGTAPTPDFSGFKVPVAVSGTNTTGTVAGLTVGCGAGMIEIAKFSFDMSNEVSHRQLVGCTSVALGDRKPKGSISLQLTDLSVKNWHAYVTAGTAEALTIQHGTAAGNIVEFAFPKVQLSNRKYSDDKGIAMIDFDLIIQPDTGNDEVVITCT